MSGRLRLAVHLYVFELEIGDAGGRELVFVLRERDVEVLEQDVADVGLAGVRPDDAERGELALDSGEADVANDGVRRRLALQVKVLRPRLHGDDLTCRALRGDVAEGDVFVVLRRVRAQLQGRDSDVADDLAVLDDHIANDGGFATEGQDAATALVGTVANADVLDGR